MTPIKIFDIFKEFVGGLLSINKPLYCSLYTSFPLMKFFLNVIISATTYIV